METLGSKKVYSIRLCSFQIKKEIFLVLKYLLRTERKALTLYLPNTYIYVTGISVLSSEKCHMFETFSQADLRIVKP